MLTDNLYSGNTPARKLFSDRLVNSQTKSKTPETEAYQACLRSVLRFQDEYSIDLDQLDKLSQVETGQSTWKWQVIDLRNEYVPPFYRQHCHRSDGALNDHKQGVTDNSTEEHPSTNSRTLHRIGAIHRCHSNGMHPESYRSATANTSQLDQSIPLTSEAIHTTSNNRTQTLFALWQPKIIRGSNNGKTKDQLSKTHTPLKTDRESHTSLRHRSKSLDSHSNNNSTPLIETDHSDKTRSCEYHSCSNPQLTDIEENKYQVGDYLPSEKVNGRQKMTGNPIKSHYDIKSYRSTYRRC
ncbi:unnamed protein product [Heterobilharzia americana]|nr:unnamed protein product [Heterobilharzia americana]